MGYTLNTSFANSDLDRLAQTGSNVIVAKPTQNGGPNVAWVVFSPMSENTMTWEEIYGIYASQTQLISGAVIDQATEVMPAAPDKLYTLLPQGYFSAPGDDVPGQGSYVALNTLVNPDLIMTVGLTQQAIVNGTSGLANAVSATPVLYQSTAVMTPYTDIYLWVQSQIVSNSVVTTVTSPQTVVTFGGSVSEVSLTYDAMSGKFLAPAGMPAGASLTHVAPAGM
jgi:hypothetical protein